MLERIGADRRRWPHDQRLAGHPVARPAAAVVGAALRCDAGPRVNRHVLLALAASARPDGTTSMQVAALAKLTGLPEATAGRVIRELVAAGHLTMPEPAGSGQRIIHVHPRGPDA